MRAWLAAGLGLLLSVAAAPALVVERSAEPLGDRATALSDREIGRSTWMDHALPASRLDPRREPGSLTAGGPASSFRLSEVPSKLRPRTEKLLGELGAREEAGRIVVSLPGDVLFDFDKSTIRADARPVLGRLAQLLAAYPKAPVAIEGHTDAKGDDAYNQALSERRAEAVRAYLIRLKVASARMSTRGLGETRPVAPNAQADGSDDPAGRQRNRRVEFLIGEAGR